MNTTRLADTRLLVLSIVLSGGIFAVDLSLPLGVAGGVPYVIVVLASLWSPRRRDTYLAAGAGTTLTALGYFLSAPGGIHWMVLVNRFLALFAIWSTAAVTLQRKKADAILRDAHNLLEIRVAERTAELAQANEALRAKEAWLRLTLEQIPASLWTTDTELHFTSTTGSGLRAQNLKSGDLVGVTLFEHFGTEDREFSPIAAHLRALRREAVDYEFSNCGMSFQVHVEPLRDANRKIAGCIALALDISERKRAEQALQLSERRYRELIDALPHGIEECDLDGTIKFSSPGNDRLKGYDIGEVAGQKIWDCSASEEAARGLQRWVRQLVSEQPAPTPWIGQIKSRDGRLLDVQVDWNYKHADDGRLTGFVSVITDITARRRAEVQAHKHQEELAHLSRLSTMGEMATGLAHELNQPLASIVNYTKGCVQRIQAGRPDLQELVAVLNDAIECDRRNRRESTERDEAIARIAQLTPREREVMDLIVEGLANKQIAIRLGISEKTVEVHRSRGRTKLRADSVAELVKIALRAQPR